MKVGDLVEFAYGRVGGQIGGIGLLAELGNNGKHKILFMGKGYWVFESLIKPICIKRKGVVNDVQDN